jgi:uroporphyrinogen decarboxylase
LAQAKNLAGGDRLVVHLRQYPDAVLIGLQTIAETTRRYVEACMEVGIDGVFYAVQHAQAGLLLLEEYEKFGIPFDLNILEPARILWCNILHLHGNHIYFTLAGRYPCQIVNWHDRETGPSLAEGLKNFPGVVCGGINQKTIVFGDRSDVQQEAADAIYQTGGRRFMLGTGCVVPVIAPHGNIMASRQMVEEIK